jgi:cytochrome c
MERLWLVGVFCVVVAYTVVASAAPPEGDPDRGARLFAQCAACHSLEPGRHLTGPSLSHIWGRKAGTVEGFLRYSPALKKAGVVWTESTLDTWLKNPPQLVPGNAMSFAGVKEERERADLMAFLRAVSEGRRQPPQGGMMARPTPDMKAVGKSQQVATITYCGDAYRVTTAAGETLTFWEFNLRFKTDSSRDGPAKGKPVVQNSGMMGDRAFVVFSAPEEIGATIRRKC